jgi:ribosome biogenesis GTPase A
VGPAALDAERAGAALAECIARRQPRALEARYGVPEAGLGEGADAVEGERGGLGALRAIAAGRGLLGAGGVPDLSRAAAVLLADFRRGQHGAVTLDEPAIRP